jgi:hypothetical protein
VIKINQNNLADHEDRLVENTYAYFLAQNYRRELFLKDVDIIPLFYSPVILFEIVGGKKF